MKLYYFNPNDYGEEYFVLAKDKTEAFKYLLLFLQNKANLEKRDGYVFKPYQETFDEWTEAIDKGKLPRKYRIEEHPKGAVIQTEVS